MQEVRIPFSVIMDFSRFRDFRFAPPPPAISHLRKAKFLRNAGRMECCIVQYPDLTSLPAATTATSYVPAAASSFLEPEAMAAGDSSCHKHKLLNNTRFLLSRWRQVVLASPQQVLHCAPRWRRGHLGRAGSPSLRASRRCRACLTGMRREQSCVI